MSVSKKNVPRIPFYNYDKHESFFDSFWQKRYLESKQSTDAYFRFLHYLAK